MRPFIVAALLLSASVSNAQYFHLFDPDHIYKVAGASIDPLSPGKTALVTETALVTHSPKDGCLFPTIVCEDWSPLMVGPSYNAGHFSVVFGPVANLAPAAKAALLGAVNKLTEPTDWAPLKAILAPSKDGTVISFGPQIQANIFGKGTILPISEWSGKGRIFAGAALKFY